MLPSRRRAAKRQYIPANDHVGWHEIAVEISAESQKISPKGELRSVAVDNYKKKNQEEEALRPHAGSREKAEPNTNGKSFDFLDEANGNGTEETQSPHTQSHATPGATPPGS